MPSKLLEKPEQMIGPYEILELLAVGGTSFIYKGRQGPSGELVAIKVPKEQMTENSVFLKRFEQEFGVARLLEHPHLIRVLQFGYDDGKPYIVMEYIEGESLGGRIQREGALPEAEAVRIIREAASALEAAHKRKIIHRDVKPDNILLTREGQAKLTDLGMAKDVEADRNLTQPLKGMGTPFFIAPEQFNDAKHAEVRSDVYALAATLYMAVTGKPPFLARGTLSIWKKKLSNDLVPPRQLVSSVSERVEKTICRALSADPDARPANCREFIKELSGAKSSKAVKNKTAPASPSARVRGRPTVDRRACVRYASRQKGTCRALAAEKKWQWTATVRDVSATGIGLVLNRRFEPGTVLRVRLPGRSGRRFYLVRVVRVQAQSARKWVVGCVFPRRLSDDEVATLL